MHSLQERTIKDFGEQWSTFTDNCGYYGSVELFDDLFAPLLRRAEVQGRRVAEIGSGTGRIVRMLLEAGAAHVLALEPSEGFEVLQGWADSRGHGKVTPMRLTGDQLAPTGDLDFVFSIGVLHHVPHPDAIVQAAYDALRPGGKLVVWLYGKEGNRFLLSFLLPARAITTRLPHSLLHTLVWALYPVLVFYMYLCHVIPLPLHQYMREVWGRFGPGERRLVVYDQLNPAYAKYYGKVEAHQLLERNGFQAVQVVHRHGYSWTVAGAKPL